MEAKVDGLEKYNEQSETWRIRLEDKVDKILWFILGQSVSLIICVLGAVVLYAILPK